MFRKLIDAYQEFLIPTGHVLEIFVDDNGGFHTGATRKTIGFCADYRAQLGCKVPGLERTSWVGVIHETGVTMLPMNQELVLKRTVTLTVYCS